MYKCDYCGDEESGMPVTSDLVHGEYCSTVCLGQAEEDAGINKGQGYDSFDEYIAGLDEMNDILSKQSYYYDKYGEDL